MASNASRGGVLSVAAATCTARKWNKVHNVHVGPLNFFSLPWHPIKRLYGNIFTCFEVKFLRSRSKSSPLNPLFAAITYAFNSFRKFFPFGSSGAYLTEKQNRLNRNGSEKNVSVCIHLCNTPTNFRNAAISSLLNVGTRMISSNSAYSMSPFQITLKNYCFILFGVCDSGIYLSSFKFSKAIRDDRISDVHRECH